MCSTGKLAKSRNIVRANRCDRRPLRGLRPNYIPDRDTVDAELHLLAAVRWSIREHGEVYGHTGDDGHSLGG
jgi:hypothetical protein